MPELLSDLYRLLLDLWQTLLGLGQTVLVLLQLALFLLPVVLWCAWWLFCVNWKKAWPVLASGAWVPVVLLMVMIALAWSRIANEPCTCLGFPIANFFWQFGAVVGLTLLALFCGWAQGRLGWTPAEVGFEPPAREHGHGHHGGHH